MTPDATRMFSHRILPAARGVEPTHDEPAPLDPEFLADLVRPAVPPALVDALVEGLVDAVLADLERSLLKDQRPAGSPLTLCLISRTKGLYSGRYKV